MITLQSYLCGQWREGDGGNVELHNPSTGEAIAQCSTRGLDLQAALAYARDVGGPALRKLTFAERGALLKRMSTALHESREELVDASTKNNGATRGDAKFDVDGAIGTLAYYAKLGAELGAKHGDKRFLVEGTAEPLTRAPRFCGYHVWTTRPGVAVHINAFNFPAWGLAEKAACAILAGVPVLTKPATSTALTSWVLVKKLVEKAELPAGVLQLVCGSVGDLCDHLLPEDVIAFTGSADTGARLRRSASVVERSTRLNVEADSINAVVLGDDVEVGSETWHMFVRHVITEMTQKSGQKCTATRRIFAPTSTIEPLQAALIEKLAAVRVGDPTQEGIDMGPLATAAQLQDALKGIKALQQDGAVVVFGKAEAVGDKGWFLAPVLLRHDEPHRGKTVHSHEVFGPVSTLMPYRGAEQAALLVARGEGSLVCSIYSDDKAFLEAAVLASATWSGRVLIGSEKVADQATTPGMVLPSCIHGGPGRAGGGEELGGERGLRFYMQRTALQGDRSLLDRLLGAPKAEEAKT
ncbi:MAG: 3,4-dehydroadipyl-CoA semialdehyde dehydrogenase [Deltaproteobacteria bacterium]|nr:3,4-dehydroadipyl-CoA semialdehyde dehydrogenase [Deltaproteobacteria bacterium]